MTPDVNVLLAASRSDHPHHTAAARWLNGAVGEAGRGQTLVLVPMVIASFLRLATNPRIFKLPTPIAHAVGFVDALLSASGVEVAAADGEWPGLRALCLDRQLAANDLPDAWLAASVTRLGEHLVTFDADFKKLLQRRQLTVLAA